MAADDDGEVFEITDFTTASEWEKFIARVEEILHEWKVVNCVPKPPAKKGQYTNGTWEERVEELTFADFPFQMTHIWLKVGEEQVQNINEKEGRDGDEDLDSVDQTEDKLPTVYGDLMNMDNDFPSRAHCVCRWYGVQDFIILSPTGIDSAISSESRAKLLLSSVSIALSDAGCGVPVFVQVQKKFRKMYQGTSVTPGSSVEFGMVHLKNIPPQYNHLAGLLDVFKAKIGLAMDPRPPVSVAVRFVYGLQDWVNSPWTQLPPDMSGPFDEDVGCSGFDSLPFGACEDPVSCLHLSCTWPSLSEDMIVENQVYSDLDPLQAPQWSVRIQMTDDPQCLLGEYLAQFVQICHRKETVDQILGGLPMEDESAESADISQALQRLTEPSVTYNIPSLTSYVSNSRRSKVKPKGAPLPVDLLNQILLYLFPDAKDLQDGEETMETESSPTEENSNHQEIIKELSRQLKSAPVDSLLYKLAVCLCILNHNQGGLPAVAQMWQEFVLEMRYRWENNYLVEGIEKGPPNMGTCLLHQKLQMLNCCIDRKIKRERLYKGYTGEYDSPRDGASSPSSPKRTKDGATVTASSSQSGFESSGEETKIKKGMRVDSSSEDEFFECDEENGNETENRTENQSEDQSDNSNVMKSDMENSAIKSSVSSLEVSSSHSDIFQDTVTHKPEGRLAPHGDIKLLHSDEQLYIPITQEPAPMTEDMLEEHAEVLAKLGTSAEGAQLRARMQSACLLSDMESFKAANPGCTLEDFVRWYSPRDWIQEEIETDEGEVKIEGHLSQRMQIPGNMWSEVWQTARPVPARRQKRLFDDTKEAEKVLHFLSSLKPADVVLHLLPMLVHAALIKVLQNDDPKVSVLKQIVEQLLAKATKVTRSPQQDVRKYEDVLRMIMHAEIVIARNTSLKTKFTEDMVERPDAIGELEHFVSSLLQNQEVAVRGGPMGPAGAIIHKLFVAAQKASYMVLDEDSEEEDQKSNFSFPDFPRPSSREYILRTMVPRPAPYSKNLPQRMYCVLVDGEFRLAGAFSSDTVFQ